MCLKLPVVQMGSLCSFHLLVCVFDFANVLLNIPTMSQTFLVNACGRDINPDLLISVNQKLL